MILSIFKRQRDKSIPLYQKIVTSTDSYCVSSQTFIGKRIFSRSVAIPDRLSVRA